jgi:hypothetical protein
MKDKHSDNIIEFLKQNVEPIDDKVYGLEYRASAKMIDGTFLPCVIFVNPNSTVNLALKRFKEEQKGNGLFGNSSTAYSKIVKHFVTNGNRINNYDIESVEKCRYAFPVEIRNQIRTETTMGWTGFVAKMRDGKYFSFGTRFLTEFFQMPDNYVPDEIIEIINHSYVLKSGEVRSHKVAFTKFPDDYEDSIVFRERPYFVCYIDNL